MTGLNNEKIARIWETSSYRHPIDRGIAILMKACPDNSREELIHLSIGERNELLLGVREKTFGSELRGAARCADCKKELEFIADADELRSGSYSDKKESYDMTFEEYEIRFRLINSIDLAAIALCSDINEARRILVRRCVLKSALNKNDISVDNLPDKVIGALSENLFKADPMSAMNINLTCPECGSGLSIPLDIVGFFWKEIEAHAKRLMREVNILARHYGWREADILSMSALRRHYYIEMTES